MSFKRATEPELRAFTVARIRELLGGQGPDRRPWLRVEIAAKANVDPGRITQVLKYGTPGHKVQNGVALILGLTPDQFHEAAREFARAHPHLVPSSDMNRSSAVPDPHPNRAEAARIASDSGEILPVAIQEILGLRLEPGQDQSVLEWLSDLRALDRLLRLYARAAPARAQRPVKEEAPRVQPAPGPPAAGERPGPPAGADVLRTLRERSSSPSPAETHEPVALGKKPPASSAAIPKGRKPRAPRR